MPDMWQTRSGCQFPGPFLRQNIGIATAIEPSLGTNGSNMRRRFTVAEMTHITFPSFRRHSSAWPLTLE